MGREAVGSCETEVDNLITPASRDGAQHVMVNLERRAGCAVIVQEVMTDPVLGAPFGESRTARILVFLSSKVLRANGTQIVLILQKPCIGLLYALAQADP